MRRQRRGFYLLLVCNEETFCSTVSSNKQTKLKFTVNKVINTITVFKTKKARQRSLTGQKLDLIKRRKKKSKCIGMLVWIVHISRPCLLSSTSPFVCITSLSWLTVDVQVLLDLLWDLDHHLTGALVFRPVLHLTFSVKTIKLWTRRLTHVTCITTTKM